MLLQVGVKAFIKNRQGKYLFLKRNEVLIDEKEASWTIPGGRIKSGEPILKGLAREIKEETGLTLTGKPQILLAQDILRPHMQRHIVRLTFLATARGKVSIFEDKEKEHNEYRWFSLKDLRKHHLEKTLLPAIVLLSKLSSKK